jgi:hypothetical protein
MDQPVAGQEGVAGGEYLLYRTAHNVRKEVGVRTICLHVSDK